MATPNAAKNHGGDLSMKTGLIAAFAGGALMILTVPALAPAASGDSAASGASSFLNRAHQMNEEEEDMASMLNSKAGDNQALMTMATTIKDDHEANDSAVKALAKQENVDLRSYHPNKALKDRLDNLNGAAFNQAFLDSQLKDHRRALHEFEQAKSQPQSRDMKVYIDQTIPVLRSHMQMVENMRHDMMTEGSPENPANNK